MIGREAATSTIIRSSTTSRPACPMSWRSGPQLRIGEDGSLRASSTVGAASTGGGGPIVRLRSSGCQGVRRQAPPSLDHPPHLNRHAPASRRSNNVNGSNVERIPLGITSRCGALGKAGVVAPTIVLAEDIARRPLAAVGEHLRWSCAVERLWFGLPFHCCLRCLWR